MRIARIVNLYPFGGAGYSAMLLSREQAKKHEVHFITTGEDDAVFGEENLKRVTVALPRKQRFWHHYWNPPMVRKLREHLDRIDPDIVHFHNIANRTFSVSALLLSNSYPTVWHLHDMWSRCIWCSPKPPQCRGMLRGCVFCRRMPVLSVLNRWLKERVFRRASLHLIAVSHWQKSLLVGSALADMPIEVIPNGVDMSLFTDVKGDEGRKTLGIPAGARVVIWAGQMTNQLKGHRDLMRVARRILDTEADVWFVFVGPYKAPEISHPRVVLTGNVPYGQIPRYLAAADVYLVNSVVMGRSVAAIPNPGRIIAIQEGWSLSNHLWVQPEPNNRSIAALEGREKTMYQEWHMFASQSDHSSWFTKERREQTANVHNKGGNFIFSDGHAEYRKHWDRASGDYGLVHPTTKKSLPFEPTRASTTTTLDAAF